MVEQVIRHRHRRPARGRRLALLGLVGAAALTAGGLTAAGIVAAGGFGTEPEASVSAPDTDPEVATALDATAAHEAALRERARELQVAAHAAALASWESAGAAAQTELAAAQVVHDESSGQAGDDLRATLAAAMDQVRTALAGSPGRDAAVALAGSVAALQAATAAVTSAQQEWAADQEAAARAAAGRSGGAGADCGSASSYQPPENTGTAFFTSTPTEEGDGSNGHMPRSAMAPLGWCQDSRGNQQWLRADAAAAMTSLNDAFRAQFGENIAIDLSYRSYEDQVAMREYYGSRAAVPGTSNHGLGTAIDTWEWDAYAFGSARYTWLVENGPAYGWVAPSWARQDGSNPEYWHFEYVG